MDIKDILLSILLGVLVISALVFSQWLIGYIVCWIGVGGVLCHNIAGTGIIGIVSLVIIPLFVTFLWMAGEGTRDAWKWRNELSEFNEVEIKEDEDEKYEG